MRKFKPRSGLCTTVIQPALVAGFVLLAGCISNQPVSVMPVVPVDLVTTQTVIAGEIAHYDSELAQPGTTDPDKSNALYLAGIEAKAIGDYSLMLDLLVQAAELDSAEACYELARHLTEGEIFVKDLNTAKIYLNRSAELGNQEALRVLAWNYLRGEYGEPDLAKGMELMQNAAVGSTRAKRELGLLLTNRYEPNLNDPEQGLLYLGMAAQEGDGESAYHLARIQQSEGNHLEAIALYDQAYTAGFSRAGLALAEISVGSESSPGGTKDIPPHTSSAERLYHKAMSLLSNKGIGLHQEGRAYAMLQVAAEQGSRLASSELVYLSGVKAALDQIDPYWLEREKHQLASEPLQ